MAALSLAEMGSMLVHGHTLQDGRRSDVGTYSNPACWQICQPARAVYTVFRNRQWQFVAFHPKLLTIAHKESIL